MQDVGRESRDNGHRFKRLTEWLELVTDYEEYHRMWGPREDQVRDEPRTRSAEISDW